MAVLCANDPDSRDNRDPAHTKDIDLGCRKAWNPHE